VKVYLVFESHLEDDPGVVRAVFIDEFDASDIAKEYGSYSYYQEWDLQ